MDTCCHQFKNWWLQILFIPAEGMNNANRIHHPPRQAKLGNGEIATPVCALVRNDMEIGKCGRESTIPHAKQGLVKGEEIATPVCALVRNDAIAQSVLTNGAFLFILYSV